MKKIIVAAAMAAGCLLFTDSKAQVHVNVNIGAQPAWGPVGYDYVEYYYLPDIEAYYYVPKKQYVYLNGPNWIYSSSLPPAYRSYDIYRGYKVVLNGPKPFLHHKDHKDKYKEFKGAYGKQVVIKDKKPKNNGHDNGKKHGHEKEHH